MDENYGIYPMLHALFDASSRLDRGAMRARVQSTMAKGMRGITAGGPEIVGCCIKDLKLF